MGNPEENLILVIDDDVELCELLVTYLGQEGFRVDTANDAMKGVELALSGGYSLVVLDVMLPVMSGLDVLRRIREKSKVPVLMLTARGEEVDRIVGLELGADDYLPKPFNPRELVARIRAVQRRAGNSFTAGQSAAERLLVVGDVELDPGARVARRGGVPVNLTSLEFSLLEFLLRRSGQIVSRDELALAVLDRTLSPYDRSIDVHMSSLRRKLGHRTGETERIRTIRGVGYLYALASGNEERRT
ncbi:response regulator transcription factor [bacterium]|nr:MAG: response regulator transcription factor [bacterium]